MSAAEEIHRFAKDLTSSAALKAEVKALGTDQAAILALANTKGYQFTMADVEALGESAGGELSDEQLDRVVGGAVILYTDGDTTFSGGYAIGIYKNKSTTTTFVW